MPHCLYQICIQLFAFTNASDLWWIQQLQSAVQSADRHGCPVHSSVPIHQYICPPCFSSMLKLMWTNPGWWSQRAEKTPDWGRSMTLGEVAGRSRNPLWLRWFPDPFSSKTHTLWKVGEKKKRSILDCVVVGKMWILHKTCIVFWKHACFHK